MVVIAIIGLLSTVVLISLSGVRAKARDARRIQDLKSLQTALEAYYNDNGTYPLSCRGSGVWAGHCPDYGNCDTNYIVGLVPDYIPKLPIDPKWDSNNYGYLYKSDGQDYMLITHHSFETACDGSDGNTTPDPGDDCNPKSIQTIDRVSYEQPTIAVYSEGAKNW